MKSAYKTSLWIAYLKSCGLVYKRTKSSYFIYDFPDSHPGGKLSRPIIVEETWDEIPVTHIKLSLRTLDKQFKDFRSWLKGQ